METANMYTKHFLISNLNVRLFVINSASLLNCFLQYFVYTESCALMLKVLQMTMKYILYVKLLWPSL